jgi:hypothetical protein
VAWADTHMPDTRACLDSLPQVRGRKTESDIALKLRDSDAHFLSMHWRSPQSIATINDLIELHLGAFARNLSYSKHEKSVTGITNPKSHSLIIVLYLLVP